MIMLIKAKTPDGVRDFIVSYLNQIATGKRTEARLAKSAKAINTANAIADQLEFVARHLDQAHIDTNSNTVNHRCATNDNSTCDTPKYCIMHGCKHR